MLELFPIKQKSARAFVLEHHRHNRSLPAGDVFRVALAQDGAIVSVALAGYPIAEGLNDGRSLEVTRVCTLGTRNACSMLYGALGRAAKALGFLILWTYTLETEPGVSPRAAGFVLDGILDERDWATQSGRPRYQENLLGERTTPPGRKLRWRRDLRRLDDEHGVLLRVAGVDDRHDPQVRLTAAVDDGADGPVGPAELDRPEGFAVAGDERVVRHEAGGYR